MDKKFNFSAMERKLYGTLQSCGAVVGADGNFRAADQVNNIASSESGSETRTDLWEVVDGELAIIWAFYDGRHHFGIHTRPETITAAQQQAVKQLQDALQSLCATMVDWCAPYVWLYDPNVTIGWGLTPTPEYSVDEMCQRIAQVNLQLGNLPPLNGERSTVYTCRSVPDDWEVIIQSDAGKTLKLELTPQNVRHVEQMVLDYSCHALAVEARDRARRDWAPFYENCRSQIERDGKRRLIDLGNSGYAVVAPSEEVQFYGLNMKDVDIFNKRYVLKQ